MTRPLHCIAQTCHVIYYWSFKYCLFLKDGLNYVWKFIFCLKLLCIIPAPSQRAPQSPCVQSELFPAIMRNKNYDEMGIESLLLTTGEEETQTLETPEEMQTTEMQEEVESGEEEIESGEETPIPTPLSISSSPLSICKPSSEAACQGSARSRSSEGRPQCRPQWPCQPGPWQSFSRS